MKRFLPTISSHFRGGKERDTVSFFERDNNVAELDFDSTTILTRKLMTLSRRRRCATEHLEGTIGMEESIDFALTYWYLKNGSNEENLLQVIQSDLRAINSDPTQVSRALKKRVLLTRYFSPTKKLEDCYSYGNIEPFVFESDRLGKFSLRDTFYDRLTFPQRINTVVSFDPEVKGHKHQIRYFRALLASYSLARILVKIGLRDPVVDSFVSDELALATGWLTLANRLKKLSIDPQQLPPDESLLYDQDKVNESAMLFDLYSGCSNRLLKTPR